MTAATLSLRPLGTGELLDRAVRLYRRHFLTFIGIVAIVQDVPANQLSSAVINRYLELKGRQML